VGLLDETRACPQAHAGRIHLRPTCARVGGDARRSQGGPWRDLCAPPRVCGTRERLRPIHAHPWRDTRRRVQGASVRAPHARAIMADPIRDPFTPPPRRSRPLWWGTHYIRGHICLRPLVLPWSQACNCSFSCLLGSSVEVLGPTSTCCHFFHSNWISKFNPQKWHQFKILSSMLRHARCLKGRIRSRRRKERAELERRGSTSSKMRASWSLMDGRSAQTVELRDLWGIHWMVPHW
jgi:hypothetical protein